jgi:uncharacterized membrane protein YbhN (UPF0104 family)
VAAPSFFVVALAAVGLANGSVLRETAARLADLSALDLVALGACLALWVGVRAAALAAATPGITLGQAVLADQTALGAANGVVVGGGAVGAAAKATMLRSWGVAPAGVAASLAATGFLPAFVTWGLAAAVHLPMVVAGTASWAATLAGCAGAALVGVALVVAVVALVHPAPARLAGRLVGGTLRRFARRLPARFQRTKAAVARFDAVALADDARHDVAGLLRRRWPVLALANIAAVAATFVTLVVALRVVDVDGVGAIEALSVLSLVRVLLAISPVPGGIGVAEVGLVATLVAAGADRPAAMGAAVLFRAVTWLVPLLTGVASWGLWRRARVRAAAGGDRSAVATADGSAVMSAVAAPTVPALVSVAAEAVAPAA